MPGLTGSSYKIEAAHSLYLDNAEVFNVTGDATKSTRLWGGDAVIDGKVNIQDLSCVGDKFGATSPVPACGLLGSPTGSPDINADGKVNIQDLSITGGNFDKCGAQPWDWESGLRSPLVPDRMIKATCGLASSGCMAHGHEGWRCAVWQRRPSTLAGEGGAASANADRAGGRRPRFRTHLRPGSGGGSQP